MQVFNVGDKVHYIPFKGCELSQYENGIVKEIPEHTDKSIRVVYHCHCAGQWDYYMNYSSALTAKDQLGKGWVINEIIGE